VNDSIIAVRYARALFAIGQEQSLLATLETDVALLAETIRISTELKHLLHNPVVRASEKSKALQLIFGKHITGVTARFLDLLVSNRRESFIPDIARSFLRLAMEARGIRPAMLTTAVPVPSSLTETIRKTVEAMYQSTMTLEIKQEPAIIGGYVLRVGDERYDASVLTKLKKIQRALTRKTIQ